MLPEIVRPEILPWQISIWHKLASRIIDNQLPHALLFYGAKGIGKQQFANNLMAALSCLTPQKDQSACNQCQSCRLFFAATHPDIMIIEPEGVSQVIKIDTVRLAVQFVQTSPFIARRKIVLLKSANTMNAFSANALLKTLEEPPANTLFILLCDGFINLPATILSRCHKICFALPEKKLALEWLSLAIPNQANNDLSQALMASAGAPLLARDLWQKNIFQTQNDFYLDLIKLSLKQIDLIKIAEKWSAKDLSATVSLRQWLDWLYIWAHELLIFKITKKDFNLTNFKLPIASLPSKLANNFISFIQKISRDSLLDYVDYLQKVCGWLNSSGSLNRQLVADDLLIKWVSLCN